MSMFRLSTLTCLVAFASLATARGDDPVVSIVVGAEAPAIEKLAAEDVAENLLALFARKSEIVTAVPAQGGPLVLVGRPASNPAIKEALGTEWPRTTEQGLLLKSVKVKERPAVIVGGGSPVATFWAASELAHRWGMRSLLTGNVAPIEKGTLSVDGFDEVLEPTMQRRAWTLMDATPIGPAAWGLADQKKLIRQLARMKFNRIVLDVEPWQPFFQWEFGEVKKTSSLLWPGGPIKVDGDTAGRSAFQGKATFDNPDFAGKTTTEERVAAGITLLSGLIDEAHRFGMTAAIAVSPFDFPKEFEGALPDTEPSFENGDLAVMPGPKAPLYEEPVQKLAVAQIKALIATYPKMDALVVGLPLDSHGDPEVAWKRLQETGTLPKSALLSDVLKEAKLRKGLLSGDESVALINGQVAAMIAVRRLVEHPDVSHRKDGKPLDVELTGVDPLLSRLGLRITPTGSGSLFVSDPLPKPAPGANLPLKITGGMDWSDMHVGVMPRFHLKETADGLKQIQAAGWSGVTITAPQPGGVDVTAFFVSRAAYDLQVTPEASLRDLMDHLAGEGIADRVLKAFNLVEEAADGINLADLPVVVPDDRIFTRYIMGGEAPAWWVALKDAHLKAMDEMYRANTRAREGGGDFTLYFARRFEAAYELMSAVDSMRDSATAAAKGEKEKQVEALEKAIESTYGSLNAHAAIARDAGDRGSIALVNRSGYRLLQKMLADAEK